MQPLPRLTAISIAPDHDTARTFRGIALRLLAMLALAAMFAIVKLVAARGIHLVESLFWRQALALPIVLGWAITHGGLAGLATRRLGAHARRTAMGMVGMALNFGTMILLPMTEAATISMSVPIFAAVFAALLLGEAVGRTRWTAVALGFAGVIVVLQPAALFSGTGMSPVGAAVALAGAIMTALITVAIRDLGRTENAASTVFWFTALSLLPLGIATPFVASAHDAEGWLLLIGLGVTGAIAQLALTGSLRLAPVAVVMPMDYSSLLWSLAAGWLLFGTLPAASTWAGAPLIIASGIVIAWREHRRAINRVRDIAA